MSEALNALIDGVRRGERRALAKAITRVESKLPRHRDEAQQILNALLPDTGNSLRVGITGIPGVGKSTFIETFGLYLLEQGKRVAVLAVDPSSPLRGGSILGDKTRMEKLARCEGAFIRPSPSEGALGGVALKTRESMLLCEAAGYDLILVETVGVGQSEYEVSAMVDFFLVLMLPNAGDELQGIKRGIMELADALLINKADGESVAAAHQSSRHYQNALQLLQHDAAWVPRVASCSALHNQGIDEVWTMLQEFVGATQKAGRFETRRAHQNRAWLEKLIQEMLQQKLAQHPEVQQRLPGIQQRVMAGTLSPYQAAKDLTDLLGA